MAKRKIRVLVVEDSRFFQQLLSRGISADPSIEVIGAASDPYQARDMIIGLRPDVMTLDIEMPRMDGIEFLKRLMPQYPIPVVVVSAISDRVFDALNAGAVDFVAKPQAGWSSGLDLFMKELTIKIKIASIGKIKQGRENALHRPMEENTSQGNAMDQMVIAMGASTGGTEALHFILKTMSGPLPGIVIVQHMPPVFTRMYAERLHQTTAFEVKEAENGDPVYPGRVLIAPGGYHMRLIRQGKGYMVECFEGEKVNGHCPSVDVLFESVAQAAGNKALGVILTGMGQDGARGLLSMRKQGARTIGQDEKSCVVYGMPKAAYDIGGVEQQLPLEWIPQAIYTMIRERPEDV